MALTHVTRSYDRYADTLGWDSKILFTLASARGTAASSSAPPLSLLRSGYRTSIEATRFFRIISIPLTAITGQRSPRLLIMASGMTEFCAGLYAAYQLTPGKCYYTLMPPSSPPSAGPTWFGILTMLRGQPRRAIRTVPLIPRNI